MVGDYAPNDIVQMACLRRSLTCVFIQKACQRRSPEGVQILKRVKDIVQRRDSEGASQTLSNMRGNQEGIRYIHK